MGMKLFDAALVLLGLWCIAGATLGKRWFFTGRTFFRSAGGGASTGSRVLYVLLGLLVAVGGLIGLIQGHAPQP